jgi:hypothetical protein
MKLLTFYFSLRGTVMNRNLKIPILLTLIALTASNPVSSQYNVILGTDNMPITQFSYTRNGVHTLDTAGNQTTIATDDEIMIDSVQINDNGATKTLHYIDIESAVIVNNNFDSTVTGVGVYDRGTEILASDTAAWEKAMNSVITGRNILNYLFYDGANNEPPGFDFDVRWTRGLLPTDYLIVSERDGNTHFAITPLDSVGNVISGARTLRFGHTNGNASPNGNRKYDWNTGFASAGRYPSQPQYMSVIRVSLFNTNVNVYGLRIDNNGDADVKFYGFSDSTFSDNPVNPSVTGIAGNVFLDSNGGVDGEVHGSLIRSAGSVPLYVSLVQNGAVDSTIPVNEDGSYLFLGIDTGTYTTVLTTNPTGSTIPSLPTGWVNTGENHGIGPGTDGNPNGVSPTVVVGDTVEVQVNFGIQSRPNSDDKTYTLNPSPEINEVRRLHASSGMGVLTGADFEDGTYNGNFPFVITDTTGLNGNILFYDTSGNASYDVGEELAPNDTVLNGDSSLLYILFSGRNTTNFTFRYSPIDSGGLVDLTPATYFVSWADPLPVDWLSFEAFQMDNGSIQLIWATASEENSDYFEVQRSSDLENWTILGVISGSGNTSSITKYKFEDHEPESENYYRLKQVDFDGSASYSNPVYIEMPSVKHKLVLYPVPAASILHVKGWRRVGSDNTVELYNEKGQLQRSVSIDLQNKTDLTLDVSDLSSGIYMFKVNGQLIRFVKN